MNRITLALTLALATLATPAAFGMNYKAATPVAIFTPPVITFPPPPTTAFSGCSSDSNTIAVGYESFPNGIRILCAEAGRTGFWTTPVSGPLVGQESAHHTRFLCPSGNALAGLTYIEGLTIPFPLCATLIPNLTTGVVGHGDLINPNETPAPVGSSACPNIQFIQSLKVTLEHGEIQGVSEVCNNIETAPLSIEGPGVDLAVRTIGQKAAIGRNDSDTFTVEVFNEGVFSIPVSMVNLEFRFDTFAWEFIQPTNMVCRDILAHKGLVDIISVGKRCTLPGSVLNSRGGKVSFNFKMQPLGPSALRPPTATPKPVVGFRVSLNDEILFGADPDSANDFAAFPIRLQ